MGCSSLKSIEIPPEVSKIDYHAFYECNNLTIKCYSGTAAHSYAVKNNIPYKLLQKIRVTKSYNKTYGDKSFKLNVKKSKENGKFIYSSSDKNVATVDSGGKVTIKGTGICIITVTACSTDKYAMTTTEITITVKPKKMDILSLKLFSGKKLKVRWARDIKSDGYEVQYSTDKKFANKTTKTVMVSKNNVKETILKKLTGGKVYYVRVRAYKTTKTDGIRNKLYGKWSSIKKSEKITA